MLPRITICCAFAMTIVDRQRPRKAPTLKECVREDLECVCGVHGYKLYAEFDYVCDSCGNSDHAEFHASPTKKERDGNVGSIEAKHIRPSIISPKVPEPDEEEEYFVSLPTRGMLSRTCARATRRLRASLFRGRKYRSKSAPP